MSTIRTKLARSWLRRACRHRDQCGVHPSHRIDHDLLADDWAAVGLSLVAAAAAVSRELCGDASQQFASACGAVEGGMSILARVGNE